MVRKLGEGYTIASCVRWGRGGLEEFAFLPISVDGLDATSILSFMVASLAWNGDVEAILLDSLTIGGFNIISPDTLYRTAGAPVVVVYTYKPSLLRLERGLRAASLPLTSVRLRILSLVESARRIETRMGPLYVVTWPERVEGLRRLLEEYQVRDRKPAPLRAAHYISSSLSTLLTVD